MDKEPITFLGLEQIKKELEELKNIIQDIKNGVINISTYLIEKKLEALEEYFLIIKWTTGKKIFSLLKMLALPLRILLMKL